MTFGPPLRCFQGVVPALIATASLDGTPNVTYLSHVYYVDDEHVALSCQFFNKTQQNVAQNPYACVTLYDPVTFEAYVLDLRFDHSEQSGPLFDTMALRIQGIASHTGMTGVFKLRSADVYAVQACNRLDGFVYVPELPALDDPGGRNELRALQVISQRACHATTPAQLFHDVLESLDATLGFEHGLFVLPCAGGERLRVTACHGYPDAVVGSELGMGEGFIGTVAVRQRMLRISDIAEDLRYGRAVRSQLAQTPARAGLHGEIPLSGLPDARSQMALPLLVGDRLVGVLALESREPLGFDEWDETFLEIVANQVATSLDNLLMRAPAPASGVHEESERDLATRRFRFFAQDDCVFVDNGYLVRNVPGRILWKLLREHVSTGRTEFSNRELRLDPWLGLPPIRDNLESRLALLRKRLALKCPELSMPSTSRGHFRLEVSCVIELEDDSSELPRIAPHG